MPITQVNKPEETANKPLLNISLPAPLSGNPSEPLNFGQHNASARKNFEQVAGIMLTIINNQKLMGMAISQQDGEIKELRKVLGELNDNIRKLLNQNEKQPATTK